MLKIKLPVTFKRKWVKALRSGEYEQTTHCLQSIFRGYCCLGVGADVLAPKDWKSGRWRGATSTIGGALKEDNRLEKKIKLALQQTKTKVLCVEDFLTGVNDGNHWNFTQIANWIDKNL